MEKEEIMKRLRGALVSGVVWGAGWFAGSFLLFQGLLALGVLPDVSPADGLMVAARLGPMGGLVGAAFSLFISVWYRGRRLSEIRWQRFAVTGGLLAGVYVPTFLLTMNLLSGDGFPIQHVLDDALLAGLLGAVMAGGSMKLAQRADARLSGSSAAGQLAGEAAALGRRSGAGWWSAGAGHGSARRAD